jgi:hypothetical protein
LSNEDAAPDGAGKSFSVWFYKYVAPMALPAPQTAICRTTIKEHHDKEYLSLKNCLPPGFDLSS